MPESNTDTDFLLCLCRAHAMHFTNRTAVLVFLQRPSGSGHTISMQQGVLADWDTGLSEYRASLKSIVSHHFLNSTCQSIGALVFPRELLGFCSNFSHIFRENYTATMRQIRHGFQAILGAP